MLLAVDSSVFVAIGLREPEHERLNSALVLASGCVTSAISVFETSMVLYGKAGLPALNAFDAFLRHIDVDVIPFDAAQAAIARDAFQRYGKGQGHPARLNLADCCAYALAKSRRLPLLFKGGDFSLTDLAAAAY